MLNERIKLRFRSKVDLEDQCSFNAIINRFVNLEKNIEPKQKCFFYYGVLEGEDFLFIKTHVENSVSSYLVCQAAPMDFYVQEEKDFLIKMIIKQMEILKKTMPVRFSAQDHINFDKAMQGLSINTNKKPKE